MSKIYKRAHAYYTHSTEVTLYFDARLNGGEVEVLQGGEFVRRPDLLLVKTPGVGGVYTWSKDVPLDRNGFERVVIDDETLS